MYPIVEQSDAGLMSLLRESGPLGITELASAMHVTATAIRQRLARLMAEGLIERELAKATRGRPSHRYRLTEKGIRQSGSNFADLAIALWQEIRQIKDPEVRAGLLRRIAQAMASAYGGKVSGQTTAERMEGVRQLLAERKVPFAVEEKSGQLPVLTALACPYPTLAEQDRGICAVEKMLFTELLGTPVRLTECRLDGASTCCRFQTN
jgi:DeoR family transcriptional regulator, suf operon transcriptional repressor